MKFTRCGPDYANNNPTVVGDPIVHRAGHVQGFVIAILINVAVHRSTPRDSKTLVLVVIATHDLSGRRDLDRQRVFCAWDINPREVAGCVPKISACSKGVTTGDRPRICVKSYDVTLWVDAPCLASPGNPEVRRGIDGYHRTPTENIAMT